MENEYLQQVMSAKAEVERDLRPKARSVANPMRRRGAAAVVEIADAPAVEVRITGFGPWRSVLVPPNAYVVHTRRGRLHEGGKR